MSKRAEDKKIYRMARARNIRLAKERSKKNVVKVVRQTTSREIERNILKRKQENNRIQFAWHELQIVKFGFKLWTRLHNQCKGRFNDCRDGRKVGN